MSNEISRNFFEHFTILLNNFLFFCFVKWIDFFGLDFSVFSYPNRFLNFFERIRKVPKKKKWFPTPHPDFSHVSQSILSATIYDTFIKVNNISSQCRSPARICVSLDFLLNHPSILFRFGFSFSNCQYTFCGKIYGSIKWINSCGSYSFKVK